MTNIAAGSYLEADPTGEYIPARSAPPATRRGLPIGLSGLLSPESPTLTIGGVIAAAVGFVLIGIAWSQIAALTNVALQMPYLVSAGITGLALVIVGVLMVNLGAKRQDGAARQRQTESLTDAVTQLRSALERLENPL